MDDGIGTFGASVGSGQHRFWFVPREPVERIALFDRVAGLLLREVDSQHYVSALYLYPPDPPGSDDPTRVFMLLVESRSKDESDGALQDEYTRLERLVLGRFADPARPYGPTEIEAYDPRKKFNVQPGEIAWTERPSNLDE